MSDNNLPGESAGPVEDATSFSSAVEGIADLLEDPETDLPQDDEAQATAGPDDGDDPEVDVSEDVEDTANAEESDGPQDDYAGGRFAADNAKVKLDDGTVISVADLKRNNLFQRDYTKKTTEHAEAVKAFEARKSEVDQQAQSLAQQVEYLNWFAEHYLPKPPTQPDDPNDYVAWHNYRLAKESYDQQQGLLNYFNTEKAKLSEAEKNKAQEEAQKALQAEFATLRSKDALFTDPAKTKAFIEEAVTKGGEWWGLTADDLGGLNSHKAYLILRDAVRYRKALARSGEVQKQVQQRPVLASGGRRANPNARASDERNARSDRLRKSGRMQDAVASLMDLDL